MKKTLKLIPALAMLLVSAILVSTSTYAWFSMNTQVSATNMQVRAVAEKGLLINEVAAANSPTWDEEATAAQTSNSQQTLLYPTSTADGSAWYHGASKKSASEAGATDETTLSPDLITDSYGVITPVSITSQHVDAAAGTNAERTVYGESASAAATVPGYYVKYTYYLKGATGTQVTLGQSNGDMNVYIKSVTATPATTNSTLLNQSLRVGIQFANGGDNSNANVTPNFYIFAPIDGYTDEYFVNAGEDNSGDATGVKVEPISGTTATPTDLKSLPAANASGTAVDVYVWYEGVDDNCKSDNATAAALDNIDIDIVFELKSVS